MKIQFFHLFRTFSFRFLDSPVGLDLCENWYEEIRSWICFWRIRCWKFELFLRKVQHQAIVEWNCNLREKRTLSVYQTIQHKFSVPPGEDRQELKWIQVSIRNSFDDCSSRKVRKPFEGRRIWCFNWSEVLSIQSSQNLCGHLQKLSLVENHISQKRETPRFEHSIHWFSSVDNIWCH